MDINPFDIFGNTREIKSREVSGFSERRSSGDEFRPDDAERGSLRLHVSSNKLHLFFYAILLGLLVLVVRTGQLQIVRGAEYRELAEDNRVRIQRIKPPRGLIYDRNSQALVENIPNFTLRVIPGDFPSDIEEGDRLLQVLAESLDLSAQEMSTAISEVPSYSYQPLNLAQHIDIEKAIELKIRTKDFPGISIQAESGRHYTGGNTFSHILGYIGKITEDELETLEEKNYARDDTTGKTGLEYSYEDVLRGQYGQQHIEVDSLGKTEKVVASEDPIPGQNIILSVDATYQQKLQELLDAKVDEIGTSGGAAIAMDPRNGEILALVTSPTYENNAFIDGISSQAFSDLINDPRQPLFNRVISGEYPSGSTIKPLIAAAALQEGIVTPNSEVLSNGGIRIGQWFFPDWKAGGHGTTNLKKAIAESVNTYFYIIGGGYEEKTGLGVERIKTYSELFGLNQQLGIDLPNEASGFLPSKEWKESVKEEAWYVGDTYHLAIGQGDLLVTPLQIAAMTSVFANGGTLYQPRLVRAFSDQQTNEVRYLDPVTVNETVLLRSSIDPVREGLREAVLSGSARSLSVLPVSAAGKTGTAQFATDKTHSWFTSFAPYENPEIVVTVMVEGGGEGNDAALPVARDFLTWYYGRK